MQNLSFTQDWFSNNIEKWSILLKSLEGKPTEALEIGCFEGRATKWMLENILTHDDSRITVIDTFAGSIEHRDGHADHDFSNTEAIFDFNVWMPYRNKVTKIKDRSFDALVAFNTGYVNKKYDFIYIDGSHVSKDVMADALLAWPLLAKDGIMIFDDYLWQSYNKPHMEPKLAIDAFMKMMFDESVVLDVGYQVAIQKTVE